MQLQPIVLVSQMKDGWPWDQTPDTAVFTKREIVENGAPILHVSHDLDDHGWQFLGLEDAKLDNAVLVCLHSIPELDPSVIELANLLPGWHAWRRSKSEPWTREPNLDAEANDDG